MGHKYTRQRQGRDFSILNYLANAEKSVESNYNNIDGIVGNNDPKDDSEKKKSMLEQLEQFKEEAERSSTPVDGHEPPQDTSVPERGR